MAMAQEWLKAMAKEYSRVMAKERLYLGPLRFRSHHLRLPASRELQCIYSSRDI